MKVMKVFDKKVGETTYYKYRINLPKDVVEELSLLDKELKVKVDDGKLVIERYNKREPTKKLTEKEKMIQKELMKLLTPNTKKKLIN